MSVRYKSEWSDGNWRVTTSNGDNGGGNDNCDSKNGNDDGDDDGDHDDDDDGDHLFDGHEA